MSKPLDLADKYDSTLGPDSEPTVRVQVPTFLPKVVVDDEGDRDTIPDLKPPIHHEPKDLNVDLVIMTVIGGFIWGFLLWRLFWH